MLFFLTRSDDAFQRALRAAVASHRPAVLRSLLTSRGERAFAEALGDLSGRVIADALSMLTASERARVSSRLSRAARHRLLDTAPDGEWPCTRLDSPSWSLLLAR
ncbi:hypothetical protein M5C97_17220 [Acidovorax sp. NCPPB 3859]|nr:MULTISPECIES: hypothetical protein [unclassified Acidovorax]MDA8450534.1 hypothetical protein [Acidovorax sp. GBBC 3297]MDA8460099.1 hypothetical protein [Acidovorax sp. GBBC 3333]MDA8465135.1 hypothetical protein [Acidovorax sp. GBBC 3332]MDA8470049.1 hypothetical protein [Acidovorax sp. GBBC 3299]WCM77248.1 hypothetical protein M5C94_17175 [Acidovorax sp. GBBC 712]